MKTKFNAIVKHPLFSGSFLMIGGSMAINALSYIYHLVVGRLLGPEEYGVLASVFSIFYILSVVPLSSSIAIVKFIASSKKDSEVAETYKGINDFVLKLAIGMAVSILILAVPVSQFLRIQNPISVMILSPIVFFSLLTLVNQSTSQGLLRFIGVVGPNFISNSIKLLLGVGLILLGLAVPGAMLAILVGSAMAYLYSLFVIRRSLRNFKGEGKFNMKPFFKFAFPVLLQAFAFTALFTVDVILVKHFLPEFEAGLYASLSTSGKIIYFAVTPIAGVMFPVVSKKYAANESYRKIFLLSLMGVLVIALGIDLIYFFFPTAAISLLFGSKYISAAGSLILMGIFMTFYSVDYFLVNYFLALGKTKVVALPIIAAVLQAILIWFMFHTTINSVLQVSIVIMLTLFVLLSSILVYGQTRKK